MATALTVGGQGPITGPPILSGEGSPEGVYTAQVGALYRRTDTGAVYSKVSGTGNTGWVDSAADADARLDAIEADIIPVEGEIVQAKAYSIVVGGPIGTLASVFGFTSGQGTAFQNFAFTPKDVANRIRLHYMFTTQIFTVAGWHGFALFRLETGNKICESWNYDSVAGGGTIHAAGGTTILNPTPTTWTFSLRGGVGQAGSVISIVVAGLLSVDEIQI